MSTSLARKLTFFWALLILAACSIPGKDLPEVSILQFDKFAHFSLFAVLGWLVLHAFRIDFTRRALWTVVLGIAYAVGTELYQGLLPFERSPDPLDALANTLGLIVALAVYRMRYGASASYE